MADIVWALQAIINDLGAHPAMRAVVLMAFTSTDTTGARADSIPQPWRRVRTLMLEAMARNAVFVVPSGNGRDGTERRFVDSYPAYFTYPSFGLLPLTVVGAVDNAGLEAPFSQHSGYISAWAPGLKVTCAHLQGSFASNGTSVSSAMVAGLAAYFLGFPKPPFDIGQGRTAYNFNKYLRETASWRRSTTGAPRVIWNLQDGSSNQLLLNISDISAVSDIASS